MPQFGKPVATPSSPGYGTIVSGTCRASIYRPMVGNGWATSVGGHVGKHPDDGNPTFRYGVHIGDTGSPSTRVAYTEQKTVATGMDHGSGGPGAGAIVTADFVETTQTFSPLNSALALYDGTRYAIDALPTGGNRLNHGMFLASSISEAYEQFFEQSGLTVPPDPFNESSATIQGWMTLWINYDANVAPLVPINRSPGGAVSDTTPHLLGDFRDNNGRTGTDRGDRMKQFRVQVRPLGWTESTYWDSTQNASQEEKDNDRFDTIYAGTSLLPGHDYEWRCQVSDHFGTWGPWSDWLDFSISGTGTGAGGVLTLVGEPSGFDNAVVGNSFQARYTHSTGLSADQVQIELYQGATLIDASPTISKSIASSASPGTLFAITQSEAGFSTLAGAITYSYRIRARSTNGVWSAWTGKQTFTTGSPPFRPDILDPKGSEGVSDYPLLQCFFTDPDGFVGLTGYADILSELAPLNPHFNGTTTNWSLVTAAGVTATLSYNALDQDGVGGSAQVQITASTAASGVLVARVMNDRVYTAKDGQRYDVDAYVQSSQTPLWMGVCIEWYTNPDGTGLISVVDQSSQAGALNTWGYRELSAIAPSGTESFKIGLCAKSNAANQLGILRGDNVITPNWTVRYRRDLIHQGEGLWTYQTTAADLPAYDTYHWRARGYDGSLFSDYSTEEAFIYAEGPVVVMLTPIANAEIESSTPAITWSTADQQRFKVQIWNQTATGGTGALIFTSEENVDTESVYVMPAGWLRNHGRYRLRVTVWNSLNQEGISPNRNFGVEYAAVVPLTNLFGSRYSMKYDPCPSGILITWDTSYYPSSQHEAYAIYRREAAQPESYNLLIGRFSSVGQTSFIDYQPTSGIEYLYSVTQMVRVGTEVVESAAVQVQQSINLCHTVISAADDGDTYRVCCQFWSERGQELNTDGNQILPWGSTKPTMMFGSAYYKTIQFTARFINNEFATMQEMSLAADQLLARRGIVCFRDPKNRRIFGVLSKVRETDEALGTLRSMTFELTEVNYTEAYT